ncbi:MAG: transporter, partial [Burkholderiales bacterium PBB5]
MPDILLLLPDFALIALGYVICRYTTLDRPIWDSAEKLVYFLLFPCLLFNAILRNPMRLDDMASVGGVGLAILGTGIVLAYALARAPGVDPLLHASGAQTAFRFNSYVALALSERLAGAQGVAWQALLMAMCVPIANVAAVWPLARQGGHGYLKELARNPLIVATVAGLAGNLAGLQLPELASITLGRIGAAALPLGLMAVGAGLRFGALREAPWLASGLMGIRHLVLPAVGIGLCIGLRLPPAQQAVLVAFSAMP